MGDNKGDLLEFLLGEELDGQCPEELWGKIKERKFETDEFVRMANVAVTLDLIPEEVWDKMNSQF